MTPAELEGQAAYLYRVARTLREFEEKWWEDARGAAAQAEEEGQKQFPTICPDGIVRDLLNDDAEVKS